MKRTTRSPERTCIPSRRQFSPQSILSEKEANRGEGRSGSSSRRLARVQRTVPPGDPGKQLSTLAASLYVNVRYDAEVEMPRDAPFERAGSSLALLAQL